MQRPGQPLTFRSKINPRDADPNEYITFIRSLQNSANSDGAERILKAIAAQVKRIMAKRFMLIGTLEEAAYNGVMAHITHMNHGPEFKRLNVAITKDIAGLQAQGYYGDGFWSDGKRLHDGVSLGAEGLKANELPRYVCGVTKSDARMARIFRGRGPASSRGPKMVNGEASHRSGRQTQRRYKAGARNYVDMGESSGRLDGLRELTKEDHEWRKGWTDERVRELVRQGVEEKKAKRRAADQFKKEHPWYKAGSTRGKQAKSKTSDFWRNSTNPSAAADRAWAYERLLGIGSRSKERDEPDELDLRVQAPAEDETSGSDEDGTQILNVEDPRLSVEERQKELDTEHGNVAPSGSRRPEWQEFFAEVSASTAGRNSRAFDRSGPSSGKSSSAMGRELSRPGVIEILDSSDEGRVPHKRVRKAKEDAGSTKLQSRSVRRQTVSSPTSERDVIRERRLRARGGTALGGTVTTLSGTARHNGDRPVSKATTGPTDKR
ncbi:hypothetical protein CspeluHIS016_0602650 [Cutaneotrichosporon spelunceum]|uniref:WLM domain-containing protein n=1 Tax=Cutaneotrichosporon spelunceum TaxID=1672016 RepID=A0AAD3YE60_9TREE|nr:hypothetical protein CspeluHIS016_0602650 [Cutaneotrichosporon spelunceum]